MSTFLVLRWLSLLVDVAGKSLVLLAAAGVFHLLLRRASAASRHLVWLLTIGSLLALPLLSTTLPQWRVRAWPRLLPLTPAISPAAARWPGLRPSAPPHTLPVLVRVKSLSPSLPASRAAHPLLPVALPAIRSARPARLRLPLGLFLIWLAGAGVILGQVLVGMAGVRRLERQCRRVREGPLATLADDLRQTLGLPRPVVLLRTPVDTGPIVPMTWGWRRPVVLLPADCKEWSESRLRSVLLHELAHVQRWDWPVQLLTCLTCALYWFHPLVWLAARQLRIESERACDDRVLTAGVRPTDYASHLLEVARSLRGSERSLRAALTIVNRSAIELRVRAILERQRDRRQTPRWAPALASLVVLGAIAPLAAVRPGDKPATRRGPRAAVLISVITSRSHSIRAGVPRRRSLVAILERRDRAPMLTPPSKRHLALAPRKSLRERSASPRAEHHPRPDLPAAPRPRKRRLAPNRLLAALPKADVPSELVPPPSPSGAEPAPGAAPERPAADADGAVLASFDEPASQDATDMPPIREISDDRDTTASTVTLAVDEGPQPGEACKRWAAALQAGQIASPITIHAAEDPDQTPEPRELELGPDTDVLPATGQDRDALSAPSETDAATAAQTTGQAMPLEAINAEPPSEDQAPDGAGPGLTVAELLVWDRARQCWDRVLVVWDGEPVSPAAPAEDPEGEWTPAPDSGSSPFEPGSMDEDLWYWDQLFQRSDQKPAGGKSPSERGAQALPCLSSAA